MLGAAGCAGEKKKVEEKPYPMFWTWLDYKAADFDSICGLMQEAGIDGVMLNAATPDEMREAVPVAHKHGIEVYAWLWTLNLDHGDHERIVREHPEWLSVIRLGWSLADSLAYVKSYKFMSPALPKVRQFVREKVRAFCEIEGVNGVAIDYNRLVDVILPTALWAHYGVMQDKDYPKWDYGYHTAMIEKFESLYGYDPRKQNDPTADTVWLQFRCNEVTEVANEIAAVVHSYGKVMAASPFPTPKMARQMVRQEWGKWDLDIVFPMVYHHFYTEDKSFISDCTMENFRDKQPKMTLFCGLLPAPEDSVEVTGFMDEALNNGAEGIAIFTIEALRSPEVRSAFHAYADEMRKRRAAGEIPVQPTGEVVTDPFLKDGVMQRVYNQMATFTGGGSADLQLGDYTLVEDSGFIRHYRVTDTKSKITFDVRFVFGGGILSGWLVAPTSTLPACQ
jgi:hypothetical protein